MEPTTVVGLERTDLQPYTVVLNGAEPVVWPAELAALAPEAGAPVMVTPVGPAVPFDRADPVAVWLWLRSDTDVLRVDGPDLTPPIPSEPGRTY
ncbi:MAG TPA: hypothetical protein VIL55_02920 [Naasia sp.]|jgi:hypothetical protein